MPPPSNLAALHLRLLPGLFYVRQLQKNQPIPSDLINRLANGDRFLSITRTEDEISIVSEDVDGTVPDDVEAKWKCIKIAGPMDFGLTGVLCAFTTPLKEAGIPIFALSTWNTDFILVPKKKAGDAVDALKRDGWTFQS